MDINDLVSFILGRNASGPASWKNKVGIMLIENLNASKKIRDDTFSFTIEESSFKIASRKVS